MCRASQGKENVGHSRVCGTLTFKERSLQGLVTGSCGHGEEHSCTICRGVVGEELAAFLTKLLAANFSRRTLTHGGTSYS